MAASYLGYITQAIVNNFLPILFISLEKIGYLVTVNFCIQLFVDFIAAKFVDKIGYRISIVAAHLFAGTGLILMGVLPFAFADPYMGLICAIVFYSIGGGLIEVLISPIVEACPTDKKSAAMSLLHSFYCWGHVAVIPLANAVYFCFVPINTLVDCEKSAPIKELFKSKLFWILILLMICSGASEQGMSQWSSAFAETGLKVSKTLGDLLGPCMFAVMMGVSRVFYAAFSGRLKLMKFISVSCVFCVIGYLVSALSPVPALALVGCGICGLSVGILWPGVFSLAAERAPTGGTAMFAFLALAGDLGCSSGPTLVGIVSSAFNDNLRAGFLAAIAFPVALIIGIVMLKRTKSSIGGA